MGPTTSPSDFTLGVEEEYQLLDAGNGDLRQANEAVLRQARPALGDQVQPELLRSQVEVATEVCSSLDDVERELRRLRRRVASAAAEIGCRLGAAGTHPFAAWQGQQVTPKDRYRELAREFQQVARETMIFGCHVHVGIADADMRIRAMNGMRRCLPVVLACSSSSPFWIGEDTGYASYRTLVFRRWPQTGMPQAFGGWAEYRSVVEALVAAGAIDDGTMIYWDLRPSWRFPTLEIRIADVCSSLDDAVTVAGIVQALALSSAVTEAGAGGDRVEILDAAVWRAARHGLSGSLIDPLGGRLRPAPQVVHRLLAHLGPAMAELGTGERITAGVEQILRGGNGADRQRRAYSERRDFGDVINLIAETTAAGL